MSLVGFDLELCSPPGSRSKGLGSAALLSDGAPRPHCGPACSSPGPVTIPICLHRHLSFFFFFDKTVVDNT